MGPFPVQPYDIFMVAILFLTAMFGAYKGMAWQLASLASLVVSAIVAISCSGALAPLISVEAPWNRFIAMLILYLMTSMTIWMLFRLVAGFIDRVRLREFDRQMGALFGLAKGVLLCVVITFFAVTLSDQARKSVLRSRSGYYIALLIQHATPVLPDEVRNVLGKYIEELNRQLDPSTLPEEAEPAVQTMVSRPRGLSAMSWRARGRGGQGPVPIAANPYISRHFRPIPTEHKKHYRTLGRDRLE